MTMLWCFRLLFISTSISLVTLAGLLGLGFAWQQPRAVLAADLPTDAQCRGCHDETERQLTFPSGELLALRIDLATLDHSAHSSLAPAAVPCSGCHVNATRYRYPHVAQPAQSHPEFRAALTQSCQDCHYPHNPFHGDKSQPGTSASAPPTAALTNRVAGATAITATNPTTAAITATLDMTATAPATPTATLAGAPPPVGKTPTCVDCHGSHTIDRMANITNTMPANCLACHEDKNAEWVAQYIAPRPRMGQAAAGYIGSARCAGCHEDRYFAWQSTLHAQMVQDAVGNPAAIVGDFTQTDPDLTFRQADVRYTIGSVWKQVYLSQTVEGKLFILPAEWHVAKQEWVAYQADTGAGNDWLANCGSCHVTGLDTANWGFAEISIGCESCHGPGQAHAKDPERVPLYMEADDQVCGACHSRGHSPDGHPFPASYRPGDRLADHFTLASGAAGQWPDGSAKLHNQQYTDWQLDNRMMRSGKVQCMTCHSVHDQGVAARQLRQPLNELCLQCHTEQKAIVAHVPFHERAIVEKRHEFTCADCHMPKLASSAAGFDVRLHTFRQPNPQGTLDHGGLAAMPNACNQCHNDLGEDPQWAAQTIAFTKQTIARKQESFFGPGPTPTSPPPPTPISVAGQPGVKQEPGLSAWLRPALVTSFWLLVALILLGILNLIRVRRAKNA